MQNSDLPYDFLLAMFFVVLTIVDMCFVLSWIPIYQNHGLFVFRTIIRGDLKSGSDITSRVENWLLAEKNAKRFQLLFPIGEIKKLNDKLVGIQLGGVMRATISVEKDQCSMLYFMNFYPVFLCASFVFMAGGVDVIVIGFICYYFVSLCFAIRLAFSIKRRIAVILIA